MDHLLDHAAPPISHGCLCDIASSRRRTSATGASIPSATTRKGKSTPPHDRISVPSVRLPRCTFLVSGAWPSTSSQQSHMTLRCFIKQDSVCKQVSETTRHKSLPLQGRVSTSPPDCGASKVCFGKLHSTIQVKYMAYPQAGTPTSLPTN